MEEIEIEMMVVSRLGTVLVTFEDEYEDEDGDIRGGKTIYSGEDHVIDFIKSRIDTTSGDCGMFFSADYVSPNDLYNFCDRDGLRVIPNAEYFSPTCCGLKINKPE